MRYFPATCVARAAQSVSFRFALLTAFFFAVPLPLARAAITPDGDVSPSDPSTWTSSTYGYIGKTAAGTLTVNGGGDLLSYRGYIGYDNAGTGLVVVDGTDSTWSNSDYFFVGYNRTGTLSITNGGFVSTVDGIIGNTYHATGIVEVDGVGSTLSSSSFLSIGQSGTGTVSITNGAAVSSYKSIVGNGSGSKGVVRVDGEGSTWSNTNYLTVGSMGGGTLSITGGGFVSSVKGGIGNGSGSTGMLVVDGAGSTWNNNSGVLWIGDPDDLGIGMLSITGGSSVITKDLVFINNKSLLAIDVGRGSSTSVANGTGSIIDSGTFRILAGAGVPADGTAYTPILGSITAGTFQALGGTWDKTGQFFIASSVAAGTSGSPITIERGSSVQRVLIHDNGPGGTNWSVGASFLPTITTAMTFTASAISDRTLGGETVLSGWTFATTGYGVGFPLYLSFNVGADHPSDELTAWRYDGSTWTALTPSDMTYDGTYASFTATFTVTGLSGYALTAAAVPEPGTFALLALGLFGLLAYVRPKRKRA
jgi:T5SS/PEP-CTERM-associated repeat protein